MPERPLHVTVEDTRLMEAREAALSSMAEAFDLPVSVLRGPMPQDPLSRDLRRYFTTINAMHKGVKRRARRQRAWIRKLLIKERRNHAQG